MALQPPRTYSPDGFSYELQYFSMNKFRRKPLQTLAVGAFVTGTILRGIMSGGVAAAVTQLIKAELYLIEKLMQKQPRHYMQYHNQLMHYIRELIPWKQKYRSSRKHIVRNIKGY